MVARRVAVQAVACLVLVLAIAGLHRIGPPAEASPAVPAWTFAWLDAAAGAATPVQVPHRWSRERRAGLRTARYDGHFQLAQVPDTPWALYLESVGAQVPAVRLNGVVLRGADEGPAGGARFHPRFLVIDRGLLVAGDNRLEIDVRESTPAPASLGPVHLGPRDGLEPYYGFRQLLKVGVPWVLAVAGLVVAILAAWLWIGRPPRRFFLWYATASFTGCLYVAQLASSSPLLGPPAADVVLVGTILCFGIAMGLVGMNFIREVDVPFERSQMALLAVIPVVLLVATLVASPAWLYDGVLAGALAIDMTSGAFLVLYFCGWELRTAKLPFLLLQIPILLVVVSFHDNPLLAGFGGAWIRPWDGLFFPIPAALALGGCTFILMQRFQMALQSSETLNRELASRVAEREAVIARNYTDLRKIEQEHAIIAERQRLLADMHDGLGGLLVGALARLENDGAGTTPVARTLRYAIADLRLILDSMAPESRSPGVVLAFLAERLAPACEDEGVALLVELDAVGDDLDWPPRDLLHLLRITQEACHNVLRHAHARHLWLRAAIEDDRLRLVIEDDGQGFGPVVPDRGHFGLGNIRRRATQLGGTATWDSVSPSGTRLVVSVPVARPATA